jgi:hypothetical protein
MKKVGREDVEITKAALSPDGKTVLLTIPALKPVTNLIIKYDLKSADGAAVKSEVSMTVHKILEK